MSPPTEGHGRVAGLDLAAYLHRIDYRGDLQPTLEVLQALHLAHATHIPFENLDILLRRPIRLDLESLQEKLVRGGRGGYCFEQNLLFAAVLEAAGFRVLRLAARVRYGTQRLLPRTHMTLLVDADGRRWVADVGFGAEGLLLPVSFAGPAEAQYAWTYRVIRDGEPWVLQCLRDGRWRDLYAFTLEPQETVDYELASYYTSTHPDSRFVQTLTAQLPGAQVRRSLRNRELLLDTGTRRRARILADDEDLLQALADEFGLRFPSGTRFPFVEPRA